MAFIYDLTDIWNNAGISFNGIKLNATDTASAAGSKLLDLQINGASKFTVGKTGTVTATGLIESTVGGFRFPDGTTQTTKATVNSVSGTGTVSGLTLTGTVTNSGSLTLGGTLVLTSGQVTTALGYTPYNATNPAGYTTNVGTVTSVSGTGTVSGLSLTGSVTTSGSLTLGGTLVLTSGQVTDALGFTPYNATNPSGYLSTVSLTSNVTGTLPIANGGTGATTAPLARTALGLGTAAVLNAGVSGGVATLDGSGTVPTSQLPSAVLGGLNYQGTWNASTNTPTLASSTGSKGYYYVVSVAGSTNLNGITDWKIGDWAVYDGSAWQKVDNTDAVSSVNGYTGTVVLSTSDVAQGTNLYFTQAAARGSVSAGAGISYNSTSGVITNSAPDQTVALTGAGTTTVTGTYPNFTITSNDSTVGTVTSVNLTAGTGVSVSGGPITSSGAITVTNTAPDQIVSLTAGTNVTVTGTYPNFTIAASGGGGGSGTVTSVAASGGTTGLTFTGSPITTAGTLTLGGTLALANGGTGATDAPTARANLGAAASGVNADITSMTAITGGISSPDFVQFDTAATVTPATGRLYFNDGEGGLAYTLKGGNVVQEVGQSQQVLVYNGTGAALTKGQVVYSNGAQGQRPTVALALATGDATSARTLGIVAESIANGAEGWVTTLGILENINTSAFAAGAQLYLSGTVAGGLTSTKTYAPIHMVYVARCIRSHATAGRLFVTVQNGYEMDELHDVSAQSPANNDGLFYNTTTSLWENKSIVTALGYTPYNATNPAGYTANTGTVTSVGGTGTVSGLTLTGTVTTSGNLTLGGTLAVTPSNFASQTANTVLAAPNGAAGVPTFRAIVAADIPTLNQNTTGTASNVTGTVAVANGGTGATTLTGVVVGNGTSAFTTVTAPSGTLVGTTDTQTLTNKRVTPRMNSQSTTASPFAWNSDSFDTQAFTALANALTINADAGTPTDGQRTIFRFEDNGTARALTWTTGATKAFRAVGVTLPTTTVVGKVTYVGCIYNTFDSRWDVVAVSQEA